MKVEGHERDGPVSAIKLLVVEHPKVKVAHFLLLVDEML